MKKTADEHQTEDKRIARKSGAGIKQDFETASVFSGWWLGAKWTFRAGWSPVDGRPDMKMDVKMDVKIDVKMDVKMDVKIDTRNSGRVE